MNDEIKEMLECLKAINDGGCVWPVYQHEAKILLDYITNLQTDNKRLQHNEKVFKGRNEKAIEYIKTHTYDDSIDGDGTELMFEKANGYDLLNILQGSDKD